MVTNNVIDKDAQLYLKPQLNTITNLTKNNHLFILLLLLFLFNNIYL